MKLAPSAYGTVDVITTTAGLLLPVVTLSIFESVLRFTMDRSVDTVEVYSNSLVITLLGCGLLLPFIIIFQIVNPQFVFLPILLILQAFQALFSYLAKGVNKVSVFAANGIFLTIITAGLNILFLWTLNLGFQGYFYSTCLGLLISNLALAVILKVNQYYSRQKISKRFMRKLLEFSLPLIPNSIAWNISNTVGRYAILIFIGATANGIFAVANKIPTILTVVTGIFAQSWQLAAIEEYESGNEKGSFFETIYKSYIAILFVGSSCLLIILKPLIRVLVSSAYYDSWKYVPLLLFSVIFSSLAGFLGSQYIAEKRTKEIFKTTIVGAVMSTALSFVLIKFLGINAVAAASFISFVTVWVIRHMRLVTIQDSQVKIKDVLRQQLIIFVQYLVLFIPNLIWSNICQVLILFIILFENREIFEKYSRLLKNHSR